MMTEIKKFVVGYLATNCYVITSADTNSAVIVDPGGGYAKIKEYIDGLGKKPVAVLCTHGHFDHTLDAYKWQESGVKVFIHRNDIELINGEKSIIPGRKLPITPIEPDVVLEGGETIEFPNMIFKVIHTPGHSKGSVCYIFNDEIIFSGDTIFFHSYGRTDFYGGSLGELSESVKKILSIEKDMKIFPGHEESTTVKEEKIFNPLSV